MFTNIDNQDYGNLLQPVQGSKKRVSKLRPRMPKKKKKKNKSKNK